MEDDTKGPTILESAETVPIKKLEAINFQLLAQQLGAALTDQVGGELEVTLQKFERTHSGLNEYGMQISFAISDRSHFGRSIFGA